MELNKLYNMDCMEGMAEFPDKYFDLAIVDPPYGININHNMGRRRGDKHSGHKKVKWDNEIPSLQYFTELFRISKNQIIWGGNYFDLPKVGSWLFWDKIMPFDLSFSMGELAWMSIGKTIRIVRLRHHGFINNDAKKIHPTQKPVQLYKWVLRNYAKSVNCDVCYGTGNRMATVISKSATCSACKGVGKIKPKIIDTHVGSGSSIIAFEDFGCEYIGFEIDKEYYEAATKRINNHKAQTKLNF